ncbi:MAG: hypothetical protein LBD51_07140 [Bifidobacteriaceae bacterium]|nr:hypothetical protein [Bifidobacteriaceae bacterium]
MDIIAKTSLATPRDAHLIREQGYRLSAGVYVKPSAETAPGCLFNRARAALLVAPPGSMICGISALCLTGIMVPFELLPLADGPVELLVPRQAGRFPKRPEVKVHRTDFPPPIWQGSPEGVALAHPAYCWRQVVCQLVGSSLWVPSSSGGLYPGLFEAPDKRAFLQAIQLGDALVARSQGIIGLDEFAANLTSVPGGPGSQIAVKLFAWVRARTDSPRETFARLIVIDLGFPEPEVNPKVLVDGRSFYLDGGWIEEKIDLEYHGRGHFDDPRVAEGDVYRRRALLSANWVVIEVTNSDLYRPQAFAASLGAAFAAARRRAGLI